VEYLMYDQGEDRWLSTLLLKTGWILQYCASAEATTQCPESFAELFNQRRRWLTSTIANLNDLLVLNAVGINNGRDIVYNGSIR
ncbi:chitin synthase, partial [Sphaeroforma arctica JP610]